MNKIGKILWWDSRDGNGIIIDSSGNEFYLDISSIDRKSRKLIKSNLVIRFQINSEIKGTLSAYKVVVPNARERNVLERHFSKQLELPLSA